MKATEAADYPALAVDLFIIWRGTRAIWPHPGRRLVFLSASKVQLDGSARYTHESSDAKTFESRKEAKDWMVANRNRRGQAYDGAEITTVSELLVRRFPEASVE